MLVASGAEEKKSGKKKKDKKKAKDVLSDEELAQLYPEAFAEMQAANVDVDAFYAAQAQAAAEAASQLGAAQEGARQRKAATPYLDLPPLMARISLRRTLFDGRTEFQSAKVVEAPFFGRILILDGDLMMTERDEFHYHEMMAHVPLAYIPDAERVLIIGGGDGGLALQVLQHPSVKNVTLVEIDKGVVELCQKYIPSVARAFSSRRMHTVFQDGAKYVKDMCPEAETPNGVPRFDVVIVDSTDAGPAFPLGTQEFYDNVRRCALKKPGIFVFNMQSASWGTENLGARAKNISLLYQNAYIYQVFQPTYASGHYALMFASDDFHPYKSPIDWAKVDAQGDLPYRYWTPDIHYASFVLPNFVKRQAPFSSVSLEDLATPYRWSGSRHAGLVARQSQEHQKARDEQARLHRLQFGAAAGGGNYGGSPHAHTEL